MRIDTGEFAGLLKRAQAFVPSKPSLPVFGRVTLVGNAVIGQDGITGIAVRTPFAFPQRGGVDGTKLLRLLERCPDQEAELTMSEVELRVTVGSAAAVFALATQADLPMPCWPTTPSPPPVPPEFSGALDVLFCADKKSGTSVLSTVHLTPTALLATEGARCARYACSLPLSAPVTLPVSFAGALRTLGAVTKLVVEQNRFWAWGTDALLWSLVVDTPYPAIEPLFEAARADAKRAPRLTYVPAVFASAIDRVATAGGAEIELQWNEGLRVQCAGLSANVVETVSGVKTRGTGHARAEVTKLWDAVRRFPLLHCCAGGRLYFCDESGTREHILMAMVEPT